MVRALLILLAAGCVSAAAPEGEAPRGDPAVTHGDASNVLGGICEASALLAWDGGWLVGDNEDDGSIHAYNSDFSLTTAIALPTPIGDVEALAAGPGGYWVVGSQSTNSAGERKPKRERILGPGGATFAPSFSACPVCEAAKGRAPATGGLSVEGAAYIAEHLWIGLRSPLAPGGAAYVLGLDATGAVEETRTLDLGGFGVRDLTPYDGGLLIAAGPSGDGSVAHALWFASADGVTRRLGDLPPSTEGIAVDPARPDTLVYVTDGSGKPGKPCKEPATWGRMPIPE